MLIENQRYIRKDSSLRNNLSKINALIAEPFYNLLCAGEEKKPKYIGAKLLDAGETVMGVGNSQVPILRFPGERTRDFRKKGTETLKGVQTMDAAISELSLNCDPTDSRRALFLVSAPDKEMNVDLVKELGDYLRGLAPEAIIRNGDYPRERGNLEVTVILSELSNVEKIRYYYTRSTSLIPEMRRRQQETESKLRELVEASTAIPSL